MDLRNSLFSGRGGQGPRGGLPGRPGGGNPPPPQQQQSGYGAPPSAYDHPRGYGGAPPVSPGYQGGGQSQHVAGGGGGYGGSAPPPAYGGGGGNQRPISSGGREVRLRLAKVDDKTLQQQYIFTNICAVSPRDFPPSRDGSDIYLRLSGRMVQGDFVVTARPTPGFPDGCIALSDPQRSWIRVGMMDELVADVYNPFASNTGRESYLAFMDVEVSFASAKKVADTTYDQEALASLMKQTFANHIFAPGQRLLLDVRNVPLALTVMTVQLADLSMEKPADADGDLGAVRSDPAARGIMVPQTSISFYKNAGSPIRLSGLTKRTAANSILAPNFKFEDMGIGGLDNEFSTVFRRAFASRMIPPNIIEKLGIPHVKGILLYGPPGTGKTLMAREIGKMLNAKEPKIINGPEVLNKYVGQSEENIRNLFADAEKEYKEKGDESQLHVIIFDELDAVCKQRGSGAGGGTGVGDSVVNQLLSKLDGVNQLNNVLLIGMTNRKDMIDDALLRPGRLEVQVEVALPNEQGRAQILKIHTAKMKKNGLLDTDVDIETLARRTPNFSGAELAGLVKSAASFAYDKDAKSASTGSKAQVDINKTKVKMINFENALSEVKAAFGASEADLKQVMRYGIIHYSPNISNIMNECLSAADNVKNLDRVRTLSVLLHGPSGSGKKALATHAAMKSEFPFIKTITAEHLLGYFNEAGKKEFIHKVFTDAYKSPLSVLILGNIERLIEWNPVGPRLNNVMVQALMTLLTVTPPKGHRLLILATTSSRSVLDQLDMTRVFDRQVAVPAVADVREMAAAVQDLGVFQDSADINQAINTIRQYNSGSDQVGVGIKRVLNLAQSATDREDPVGWFAEQMGQAIAQFGSGSY
ncbi:transport between ER and Golgi ATPase protein [Sporothrix eucalyptigena]|uniref:Vesicular-fusion protein SEC18 n=1 Tax=Sporothrix eucalyptigena TaxID=1812306 RepID=A0ABP0BMI1_9PEZI